MPNQNSANDARGDSFKKAMDRQAKNSLWRAAKLMRQQGIDLKEFLEMAEYAYHFPGQAWRKWLSD